MFGFPAITVLWGLIPSKVKIAIVVAVVGALITGGVYFYIKWEQHRISSLETELLQSNMKIAVIETQQKQQAADLAAVQELTKTLSDTNAQNQAALENLRKKLTNQQIGKIAKDKPEQAQIIVNRDSIWRTRCLEIAAGSPITPEELAAPVEARNQICPELFTEPK